LHVALRDLPSVQRQLTALGQERSRLSARIIVIKAQIQQIDPTHFFDPRSMLSIPGVAASARVLSIEDRARILGLEYMLVPLYKQALDLDRQIFDLQSRAAELMDNGQQASQAIAESQAAATEAEKRAHALERRLDRATKSSPPRASTRPVGRMATFSTYAPFPYEQEKARVLAWFAK
jgi:hypothetical protein